MKPTLDGARGIDLRIRPLLMVILALLVLGFAPLAQAQSPSGLSASMTVDKSEASPGDWVTFRIAIEPHMKDARNLVVTGLLPAGLAFVSAEAPPSCTGGDGRWECSQPDDEAFSIEIRTVVEPGTEGLELVNVARIEFGDNDDGGDRKVVTVQAGIQVVEAPSTAPHIVVQFSASQETVIPGDEVNYRIHVTNNGTAPAPNVSVIAFMPAALVLVSASPWPVERAGELEWSMETLVGSFEILFNTTVPYSNALTEINVALAVTYGDGQGGEVHVETQPSTLSVVPVAAPPVVSIPPLLLGAVAVGGLCVFVVLRIVPLPFRRGEGAEEIFLLHRGGVVLKHFTAHSSGKADSDIVGGMMAAVRMFVEDSVSPDAGPLREIRFGRGNILFVTGENVTLAAVNPKGNAERFVDRATKFLREFEEMNEEALAKFDGNAEGLEGIEGAFAKFAGNPTGREAPARAEAGFVPRQ